MDDLTIKFSNDRFNEIKSELSDYLSKIGFKSNTIPFIPISGFKGDNLTEKSANTPWCEGSTLIEVLNSLESPKKLNYKPLRLPIKEIYKIKGIGTVIAGRVETGILKPGMLL